MWSASFLGYWATLRNPHAVKRQERLKSVFLTEGGVKISLKQAFRNVKAYSRRYIQVGPRSEWNKNLRYGPFWTPGKDEQPGCPICLGEMGDSKREVCLAPCGHEFDKACIDGFCALFPACPLCHVNGSTGTAPSGPTAALKAGYGQQ
eukprot:jgi/Mesen1/1908/ME000143S00958